MIKKNKTIAILGVDGSGKSTAVENVSKYYGEQCTVTYMGYTRFEDPKISQLEGRRFATPFIEFRIYRCFWRRYFKGKKAKQIAIFDRYVHEIFINAGKGKYDRLRILLYKYLFPMPSLLVYLHCPAEVSLRRKSDIPDPDVFMAMKKRFDNYFLGQKNVLCLDSGVLTPEEIADKICEYIDNPITK